MRNTYRGSDAYEPVIFSHSNVKSLCDHPRNLTDDQIKACAQQNGVVGVTGVNLFLNDGFDTSTQSIVEHIDYIVQLVGPEYVGIGLDYVVDQGEMNDFISKHPDSFKKISHSQAKSLKFAVPEQIGEIPELLYRRGYSRDAVENIMGKNFSRVAQENWL